MDPDAFLKQEVDSASPAKLRLLLIRKAHGLCHAVLQLWAEGKHEAAAPWMLRIREILTELLDGVKDPFHPSAKTISDMYVFLIKTAIKAEVSLEAKSVEELVSVLEIEMETWNLFVQKENGLATDRPLFSNAGDTSTVNRLHASATNTAPSSVPTPALNISSGTTFTLNLEA